MIPIMTYTFDTFLATKYGVNEAILLNNFIFWIAKNEANRIHFHDGRYWTYNSVRAFAELFPFWSEKQIRTTIASLERQGVLLKGNYNEQKYDRSLWYSFSDEFVKCILHEGQIDFPKRANGLDEKGEPIPYNKPNINTNRENRGRALEEDDDLFSMPPFDEVEDPTPSPKPSPSPKTATRFTPPTLEEVAAYCRERGNKIDPQHFVNYYTSNGWMVGKNKMKDWRAAVRNWETRDKERNNGKRNIDPGSPAAYRQVGRGDYYGESTI